MKVRILVAPAPLVLPHLFVKLKDVVEVIPHLLHREGGLGLGGLQLRVLGEKVRAWLFGRVEGLLLLGVF